MKPIFQIVLVMLIAVLAAGCPPKEQKIVNGVKKMYYYRGGPIRTEHPYKDGQLHGVAKTYYKGGEVRTEVPYKNGEMHGKVKRYDPFGALLAIQTYKNGVKTGEKVYATGDERLVAKGTQLKSS